jgi:hypothetical protein
MYPLVLFYITMSCTINVKLRSYSAGMIGHLRISNKYGSVTALKNYPTKTCVLRAGLKNHWPEFLIAIKRQFHTSIFLSIVI